MTFKPGESSNFKHGHTTLDGYTSRTYNTWRGMKARCSNSNSISYRYYGGKNIKVCDRWLKSFSNFLIDMGERPKGMTLDRINSTGNYEPGNCQWATYHEQTNNRSKSIAD